MKNKATKRAMAWVLTFLMVFALLPVMSVPALAADYTVNTVSALNNAITEFNGGNVDKTIEITADFNTNDTYITTINCTASASAKLTITSSSGGTKKITRDKTGTMFAVTKGELILENITIDGGSTGGGGFATDSGGVLVNVSSSGTLTMKDGSTLQNNIRSGGNGSGVQAGGTFNMSGTASITNCTAAGTGGGVNLTEGTFNMSGSASITNCTAGTTGGGVNIDQTSAAATFNMSDSASITNCTAATSGGGVFNGKFFNISGAPTITGNKIGGGDANTGGVYSISSRFIIKVGTLTGSANSIGIEDMMTTTAGTTVVSGTASGATAAVTADLAKFYISNSAGTIGTNNSFVLSSNNIVLGTVVPETRTLYFRDNKFYDAAEGGSEVSGLTGWSVVDGKLELDGFNFETTARVALQVPTGTIIELVGDNEITSTYNGSAGGQKTFGIVTTEGLTMPTDGTDQLTITGDGKLTVTSGITSGMLNSIAIYASYLTISGGEIFANGGDCAMSWGIASARKLTISAGTIHATGHANATMFGVGVNVTGFEMTGGTLYAKGGLAAAAITGTITGSINIKAKNGGDYTEAAALSNDASKITKLGADGAGANVTDAKITGGGSSESRTLYFNNTNGKLYSAYSDPTYSNEVTGLSGWSVVDGKLVLNNFSFETTAATALQVPAGTTIVLEGDNTITSTFSGNGATRGIYANGALTIQGSGKLTATGGTSTNFTSAGIECSVTLSVTGGEIIAKGGGAATSSYGIDCSVNVSGGKVKAEGGAATQNSYGINVGTFSISSGEVEAIGGTAGTGYNSRGITGSVSITGGTVTASGNNSAFSSAPALPTTYTADFSTNVNGTGGTTGATSYIYDASHKYVKIATGAATPVITISTQPATSTSVTAGSISGSLSVTASVTQSASLSYQWYSNTTAANTGGSTISGATSASLTIPTGLAAGTYYYYCVVSATGATSKPSNVATVTVAALPDTYVPLTLTGFNVDVVAEALPVTDSTTNAFDTDVTSYANYSLYSNAYAVAYDVANNPDVNATGGLPDDGVITSTNQNLDDGLSYQLAAYNGNNALKLTSSTPTGILTLSTPSSYSVISILGAGASGESTMTVTITFENNTTQGKSFTCKDWYGTPNNIVINTLGRVAREKVPTNLTTVLNRPLIHESTGPNLYEYRITDINTSQKIKSITFSQTSVTDAPYTTTVLMAVSGVIPSGTSPINPGTPSTPSTPTPEPPASTVIVDGKEVDAGKVDIKDDTTTVTVKQDVIQQQIDTATDHVKVIVPAETGTAVAQLVVQNVDDMAAKDMNLTIQVGNVQYQIPTTAIDTSSILSALGADSAVDVPISISITTDMSAAARDAVQSAVMSGGSELVIPPMEFKITATYNGQSVEISTFNQYVARSVEITAAQAAKVTTAVVVDADGTTRQVPTRVYQEGGKWYAEVNSLTNSTYALIYNELIFADAAGKWYQDAVNEMGSRKIINGVGGDQFAGERDITRAEFAAIIVRALGLPATGNGSVFSDVANSEWYSGAVGTAYEYGLVSGVGGNQFAPDRNITRQEAMLMIQRAAKITGFNGSTGSVGAFSDSGNVSSWALDAAQWNVGSGLIVGSNGKLNPTNNITRAETATLVLKLMQKAELVDVRTAF